MSGFLPDGYEWTSEDSDEAAELAERFRTGVLAQVVRAESMAVLKQCAQQDPASADVYERAFDAIKQEAVDAERSAHRALGVRGRIRAWYRTHRDRYARDPLQRLPRMVRRALASLPRLRLR